MLKTSTSHNITQYLPLDFLYELLLGIMEQDGRHNWNGAYTIPSKDVLLQFSSFLDVFMRLPVHFMHFSTLIFLNETMYKLNHDKISFSQE